MGKNVQTPDLSTGPRSRHFSNPLLPRYYTSRIGEETKVTCGERKSEMDEEI